MFKLFKSETPKAGQDNNFTVSDELRIAIADAGLEDDLAIREMIKTGFVSPGGKEWDPIEFIEQRKALVEAGEAGAEEPDISSEDMVQHSPVENESRLEMN
jgi:hypothetical protein